MLTLLFVGKHSFERKGHRYFKYGKKLGTKDGDDCFSKRVGDDY